MKILQFVRLHFISGSCVTEGSRTPYHLAHEKTNTKWRIKMDFSSNVLKDSDSVSEPFDSSLCLSGSVVDRRHFPISL